MVQFFITADATDYLRVRWDRALPDSLTRALGDDIDCMYGVEYVHVGRYTAEVEIAEHLVSVRTVANAIRALLEEANTVPPHSQFEAARRFHVPDLVVELIPSTIRHPDFQGTK